MASVSASTKVSDYVHDVHAVVTLAKARHVGRPVILLDHSAGGVVSCVYTLEHQAELVGLIRESFAFQVAAPDFALAVVKGLSKPGTACARVSANRRCEHNRS